MNKIAEVIIDSKSKAVDRVFDYTADDTVKTGMRVKVPFGKGNRSVIGFVVNMKERSDYKNLKSVSEIIDEKPLLSEMSVQFAEYIKKTCLCSMQTALKLMLPPTPSLRYEYIIKLTDVEYNAAELTAAQQKIIEALKSSTGGKELEELKSECGFSGEIPVNKLVEKGIVSKEEILVGGIKTLKRKFVTLADNHTESVRNELSAIRKVHDAFEILLECESVMLSELVARSSRSAVNTLIKKGYAFIEEKTVSRINTDITDIHRKMFVLSEEQKRALNEIIKCIDSGKHTDFLLYGVTGSGKTEVFLRAAQACANKGRNVIILVPEISLTPQMSARFVERFGERVALLHSGRSLRERYDEWHKIKNGEINIVVGTRSAIFAPLENIGLIVVDEEHDTSYKSESTPKYDAVNAAIYRGIQNKCAVVLASATPRIESFYNAEIGKYKLLTLKNRVASALPDIRIADLSRRFNEDSASVLSNELKNEIALNLKNHEQTILFLNRRGFSTFITCRKCGYTAKCPRCSVTLTYHSKKNKLLCHYCGYETENINVCPECGSMYIKYSGTGTQKLEDELKNTFNDISVIRVDADTVSKKTAHRDLFEHFKNEHIDVMIGTQMVTKGLDFSDVTLVGVIAADAVLNLDDYRAAETAFAQFTQVCGRAGRGSKPGRALIQTYNPSNPVLALVLKQDYTEFYKREIAVRAAFDNPPFSRLINFLFTGNNEVTTERYAKKMSGEIIKLMQSENGILKQYYGPSAAPIEKIDNKYRYRLLVKTQNTSKILDILHEADVRHESNKQDVYMDITISPVSVL